MCGWWGWGRAAAWWRLSAASGREMWRALSVGAVQGGGRTGLAPGGQASVTEESRASLIRFSRTSPRCPVSTADRRTPESEQKEKERPRTTPGLGSACPAAHCPAYQGGRNGRRKYVLEQCRDRARGGLSRPCSGRRLSATRAGFER